MIVAKGKPEEVLPKLIKALDDVKLVTFEKEQVEPYGIKRDKDITQFLVKQKIEVKSFATHTLFDQDMLLAHNDGNQPKAYNAFLGVLEKNRLIPAKPLDTFEGFKDGGHFNLPQILKDRKTTKVQAGKTDVLELYEGVPSIK